MKKITLTLLALLLVVLLFAQAPQSFKYQAVARDNAGEIMNNQLVSFRISILQGSATGTSMYSEIHQTTTNDFGLANLEIGNGSFGSGNFTTIDWSAGPYFMKVEMDPTGGTTYQFMGSSQLLSVPYALYSENTANPDDSDWTISGDDMYSNISGNLGIGTTTPIATLEVAGNIAISNTGGSVFLGLDAGANDDLSDNYNVFIGEGAGQTNTTGYYNTACGGGSFYSNSTGYYNTSIGHNSLNSNTIGGWNIAIGSLALENSISGNTNSAVGHFASGKSTTGSDNTSVGYAALHSNVTGIQNTVVGSQAGFGSYNSSINGCVFLGYNAGRNVNTDNKLYIENSSSASPLIYGEFDNDIVSINGKLGIGTISPASTLDVSGHISTSNIGGSVFIGLDAGANDDLSDNINVFIGESAGQTNTTGYYNTACGGGSFFSNTTGYYNAAIGQGSLNSNTNGRYNIAIGSLALEKNSTGITNSGIGHFALGKNTSGSDNTAAGGFALHSNVLGSENTAVGSYAGYGSINNSVNGCVFIGYRAGYYENTDNKLYLENSSSASPLIYGEFDNDILAVNGKLGIGTMTPSAALEVSGHISQVGIGGSVFLGKDAGLNDNLSSNINVFIGGYSGTNNISGDYNVAVGGNSLDANTTGSLNVAIGDQALTSNVSGYENTAVGSDALYYNATGYRNTAIGHKAGYSFSGYNPSGCVYLGYQAGFDNTSSNKLYIENSSAQSPLIYGDFYNDIVAINGKLGVGTQIPNAKLHVNTIAGENGYRVQIVGSTKFLIHSNGGVVIGYNVTTPTFALQLQNSSTDLLGRGLAYSWTIYSDDRLKSNQHELEYGLKEVMQLQPKSYDHHSSEVTEEGIVAFAGSQKAPTIGFIAQEVKQIIPEAVYEPADDSKNLWGMDYEKLIPVLTKAIQEQQAMIEEQHNVIETMQLEILNLKNQAN